MAYKAFIVLGSFKARGIVNQFAHIPAEIISSKRNLVSISAGNYGKAFAIATKKQNLPAKYQYCAFSDFREMSATLHGPLIKSTYNCHKNWVNELPTLL